VTEAALIAAARQGSHRAFTGLVSLHQARVRGYIARFVSERDRVDDIAQEVFLAAFRGFPRFSGDVPVEAWLVGIARNQALVHLRSERRRREAVNGALGDALTAWRIEMLDAEIERGEDRSRDVDALGQCLGTLASDQRSLVEDHYLRRHSSAMLARQLGRGEGAVRMMLLRIRQTLRACIERRLRGEATS